MRSWGSLLAFATLKYLSVLYLLFLYNLFIILSFFIVFFVVGRRSWEIIKQLMNTNGYTPTNHVHTHTQLFFLDENMITLYHVLYTFQKLKLYIEGYGNGTINFHFFFNARYAVNRRICCRLVYEYCYELRFQKLFVRMVSNT